VLTGDVVRVTIAILLATVVAHAEPAADEAARLFEEARTLAAAGNYVAACARFAASYELVPAPGTQLNLADCHERQGRLAAAWHEFDAVATAATRAGNADRAKFARQRADGIAPKLLTVIVKLPHPEQRELAVTIAGKPVPPAAAVRELVDPGDVAIAVTAPGVPAFSRTAHGSAGATVTIEVPEPAAAPTADTIEPPPPSTPPADVIGPRRHSRVLLAYGVAGVAGASAIAGTALLIVGRRDYDAAAGGAHCQREGGQLQCDDTGTAQIDHARRLAKVSTGFAVGTGAALAAAAILYVTAPREPVVAPVVGGGTVGVAVGLSF